MFKVAPGCWLLMKRIHFRWTLISIIKVLEICEPLKTIEIKSKSWSLNLLYICFTIDLYYYKLPSLKAEELPKYNKPLTVLGIATWCIIKDNDQLINPKDEDNENSKVIIFPLNGYLFLIRE